MGKYKTWLHFRIMARLIVVLLTWTLRKQLVMIALATKVATEMEKNILKFATPDVTLVILAAAAKRLQEAYNGRKNGANAKLEYTNAGIALDGFLHTQANYVNNIAKGDATIIGLSGYTASNNKRIRKTKTGAPGPVGTLTPGGGILELSIARITNASWYIFVIFPGIVGEIIIGTNYVRTTTDSIIITHGGLRETVSFLTPNTYVTVVALTQNAGGISPAGPSTTKLIN